MSEQPDNDLKNRIHELFDNYEDDTADAGWELLRQKFPEEEKKRRVIPWWWYSSAAVLLLCLGTWFFYPKNTPQQVTYRAKNKGNHTLPSDSVTEALSAQQPAVSMPGNSDSTAAIAKTQQVYASQTGARTQTGTTRKIKSAAPVAGQNYLAASQNAKGSVAYGLNNQNTTQPVTPSLVLPEIANAPAGKTALDKSGSQNQVVATQTLNGGGNQVATSSLHQQSAKTGQIALSGFGAADTATFNNGTATKIAVQQPAKATQQGTNQKADAVLKMIAADDARQQAMAKNAVKKTEKTANDKATILALYAATYFNYAKGSESQVNVGGGFTSDFKLSKNFKLSTGLAIAQNRLNYTNNNLPQQINQKVLSAAANASKMIANASALFVSSPISTTTSPQNYSASLVGLDIPINLKYQFNPQKNDTYISAGISSGTYINETYRSTYAYSNYSTNTLSNIATTSATQQSTTNQHFSTFDFAKTLNLSFGIGYPVGKSNRLVIEPFLKYPLNGLGAQDIKFGASGLNLKLSFSGSKK